MKTGLKMIQKAKVQRTNTLKVVLWSLQENLKKEQLGESQASYVKYKEIMSGSRLLHNLRDLRNLKNKSKY